MNESEWQIEFERSIAPYRIAPDSPPYPDGSVITSLDEAVAKLQSAVEWEVKFESRELVENENWWYIPFCWIGCAGYIVDKFDGYINQLGSCHPMDACFWGHNQNIKYGYSDLTINQINNYDATISTLMKMGNRAPINPIPNKTNSDGNQTEFFTESDIKQHLEMLPSTFENQRLWFTIPALKKSVENNDFEFVVSRGSWDMLPNNGGIAG